jgi:hypothetical protein
MKVEARRPIFHERAPLIAVRAVHAAVARFRLEDYPTAKTLVEVHAAISGHRFNDSMPTGWADDGD